MAALPEFGHIEGGIVEENCYQQGGKPLVARAIKEE